jgi:tetratricopeptide (TPR) repeat protein
VLVFLTGSSGVLWQWHRASRNAADFRRERDAAQQEKERAEHHLQMICDRVDQLKRLGSNLLLHPGQYRNGHAALEQALGFYRDMLPEDLNDPKVREKAAELFGQVAVIHRTLGEADNAVEAYGEKARLLSSLLEEKPADKDLRIQLADTHRWRGNVQRDQGKEREAREAYDLAAGLTEGLVRDYPDVALYKVALANTFVNITALPSRADQIEELETLCSRMLELYRSAVDAEPKNSDFKMELALGLQQQGLFFLRTGRLSDAEDVVREALAIHQSLLDGGQMKGSIERPMARNFLGLGRVLAAAGKEREAEKSYKEAVKLLDQPVDVFPESALRRAELAQALTALANLLKDPDRRQEVKEIRCRAIRHYETLKDEFPKDAQYRRNLANSYLELVNLLCELGRQKEADEPYRKALGLESDDHALNNTLAWFLATSPEPRLRDPALAVRLAKKAVNAEPKSADYRNTLGVALYRNGDDKAAVAELETAMSLRAGGNSDDWFFLAMAYRRLGDNDKAQSYFDRAVQWMDKYRPHDDETRRFRAEAEALLVEPCKH